MKNLKARAEMVKSMDMIARSIDDERYVNTWLMCGVADEDIKSDTTLEDIIDLGYCDDNTYSELKGLFLKLMVRAEKYGGLV